jgi:pimeloyl-ACP methyl ester carboxylesterase
MTRPQQIPGRSSLMSSSARRKRVVPISFQLAGMALNLLSLISVERAAKILAGLWFTVFKNGTKAWVTEFWASADECIEITVDQQSLPVYSWGQGRLLVCMHGWSGSGTQFRHFIKPLVAVGFRVVCFDAPAHGSHPGRKAHALQFSECLLDIQRQLGPVDTVMAHSLGAMSSTWAIRQGLKVRHAVLFAAHLNVEDMFETYRQLLNMRASLAQRFHQKIGERMSELMQGQDPWEEMVPARLLAGSEFAGMLVYDCHDEEVSAQQFDDIVANWPAAEVFTTEGLGHNGVLKDQSVIAAVVNYLSR